jgi:hypothetical protein
VPAFAVLAKMPSSAVASLAFTLQNLRRVFLHHILPCPSGVVSLLCALYQGLVLSISEVRFVFAVSWLQLLDGLFFFRISQDRYLMSFGCVRHREEHVGTKPATMD